MFLEPHIHTSGISLCSNADPCTLVKLCVEDTLDAIVLTNHCKADYLKDISWKDWTEKYIGEFNKTVFFGEKYGLKVFFGIEVTCSEAWNVDYLMYGLTPEKMRDMPPLPFLSKEKLSETAREAGCLFYQAHPFRNRAVPQPAELLDGVEINCHPAYRTNEKERVTAFAAEHGLRLSCGSDYHNDIYKARCGMTVPDEISSSTELERYLRYNQPELRIHDIITF